MSLVSDLFEESVIAQQMLDWSAEGHMPLPEMHPNIPGQNPHSFVQFPSGERQGKGL